MTVERDLKWDEIPHFDVMVERHLAAWEEAKRNAEWFQVGYNWYGIEHQNTYRLMLSLYDEGFSPNVLNMDKMCDVVSVISPGRLWDANLKDAFATVMAWQVQDEGIRRGVLSLHKVALRYGLANFRKAWGILDGTISLDYKKSPKTFAFGDNLEHPFSSPYLCFDQHNCHIALGERDVMGSIGISYKQYLVMVTPLYKAAEILGEDHKRVQSATWYDRIKRLESRRKRGKK